MALRPFVPALAVLLSACASAPPDWITAPAVARGFAAAACVADSGNLSRDRQATVSQARAALSRQIGARAEAMDRAYAALATDAAAAPPGTFAGAAPPVVEEALAGLQPTRVEYVERDDAKEVCALMALEEAPARAVFERIIEASGRSPGAEARAALYRAFTAAP